MAYWIQGLFFQPAQDVVLDPTNVRILVEEYLGQHMFHGSIWQDLESPDKRLVGVIDDHFGTADLSDIRLSDSGLAFTKKYRDRPDKIHYIFERRDGQTWIGTYTGVITGKGLVRCLMTELPDEFFTVESIEHALSKQATSAKQGG